MLTLSDKQRSDIIRIWDQYVNDKDLIKNDPEHPMNTIDVQREDAIITLRLIIKDFLTDKIDLGEFKTDVDSYNKLHNLWGFTSIKGQMFFNLLAKNAIEEEQRINLTKILKQAIDEPTDINQAVAKIKMLNDYVSNLWNKAPDKRKVANPGSIGYFLSYFWQIQNHEKWPIIYSSITKALLEIGVFANEHDHVRSYETFYFLYQEIKETISKKSGKITSNWEAEHAFWNFKPVTVEPKPIAKAYSGEASNTNSTQLRTSLYKASFDIYDFIIPLVSKLVSYGNDTEKSSSGKGVIFERTVAEIFRQLDFEVDVWGQGSGRNPDAIAKFRQEHTAFIIDAKAYGSGYSLGLDDRAIREYIGHHTRILKQEGFTKIGFIIVSNSFKTSFESFINEITWSTEIKRFILMESDALLHLLAYKNKDKLPLSQVINIMVSLGNKVSTQDVIQNLEDV